MITSVIGHPKIKGFFHPRRNGTLCLKHFRKRRCNPRYYQPAFTEDMEKEKCIDCEKEKP